MKDASRQEPIILIFLSISSWLIYYYSQSQGTGSYFITFTERFISLVFTFPNITRANTSRRDSSWKLNCLQLLPWSAFLLFFPLYIGCNRTTKKSFPHSSKSKVCSSYSALDSWRANREANAMSRHKLLLAWRSTSDWYSCPHLLAQYIVSPRACFLCRT